ncbi:Rne/Rng family ribonuclease [Roseovarius gahaiensis]|uniref:Ribonuclease E n=1 Tax=Roseovarius gahaiensis TaxID=2716691 RepID=A0A967EGN8_9RHOB|nr:ribonuclease E/G [Roseovarius gahaiensis]NHQ75211.1 Rne/Rng family ribonuclease [Roseovarius gahaiensis]
MANKMLIDATHAEETRVVVVDGNKVEEFDFESENKRQLAGNIYLAKVTRVEPSLQAAFVDYGGNRHGFLAFSEIHPDYYQIPVADREKLMEEERAYAEAMRARDEEEDAPKRRNRSRSKPAKVETKDPLVTDGGDSTAEHVAGMEMIDLDGDLPEGTSPVETVAETPVEEPLETSSDVTSDADSAQDVDGDDFAETDDDRARRSDAAGKDDSIESVADDDDSDDIRPVRKPRPRKYKIQEVIKVRQILLVQVVKEERGNKGAALTTYLSLAGRYCVLMPNTARGGGISRKITNAVDRKKLKQIATEIDVPQGAGLIVRTAGAKRTKSEIKRDYEYLQRLWEQIRELTLKSVAPAKIYEEGDLIKRSIRDLYNREIDEVLVEGERGYRIAKDFMKMIMPSHAKNVKLYADPMPLFARHQVESYLSGMFNPTVQLKSGGYIVIGVTEALVAVDVNSGRATKEGSIEETALKTNLEAAEEVARQLRLRDLAGLIVIDFIDMDERKNNNAVEKKLKDKLKSDRARIQVGRISGFGLLEMSRQRLRPGMIEATTQPCPACHGTGLIRSDDNLALSILRQIEEEGVRRRSREVLVKCPVGIANFLMNQKREHVAQIEARYGLSVRIEGDPVLISPDFALEKFKTATRSVPEVAAPVVSVDSSLMEEAEEEEEVVATEAPAQAQAQVQDAAEEGDDKPKKRRRRRRRRSKSKGNGGEDQGAQAEANGQDDTDQGAKTDDDASTPANAPAAAAGDGSGETTADKPKPKRTRKPRKKPEADVPADAAVAADPVATSDEGLTEKAAEAAPEATAEVTEDKPKPKRTRKPRAKKADVAQPAESTAQPEAEAETATDDATQAAKPARKPRTRKAPAKKAPAKDAAETEAATPAPLAEAVTETAQVTTAEPAPAEASTTEPVAADPTPAKPDTADAKPVDAAKPDDTASDKPKRRGWWSIGR